MTEKKNQNDRNRWFVLSLPGSMDHIIYSPHEPIHTMNIEYTYYYYD